MGIISNSSLPDFQSLVFWNQIGGRIVSYPILLLRMTYWNRTLTNHEKYFIVNSFTFAPLNLEPNTWIRER